MPNEDGLFTQAEVDKILRERLKPEKGKLDTARDEAAQYKAELAKVSKSLEAATLKASRADEFEADLTKARGDLEAKQGRWGNEKALMGVLGDKYDDDVAEVLIAKYGRLEDGGDFQAWATEQAESRSGLFGTLLGAKPEPPTNGAGAPLVPQTTPTTPQAPAVNGGAGGAPPPAPAFSPGSIASSPAAEWAATRAEWGLPAKGT